MTTLPLIAAELANVARRLPCTCRPKGAWPVFANEQKATQCARCACVEVPIVQTPEVAARQVAERAATDE